MGEVATLVNWQFQHPLIASCGPSHAPCTQMRDAMGVVPSGNSSGSSTCSGRHRLTQINTEGRHGSASCRGPLSFHRILAVQARDCHHSVVHGRDNNPAAGNLPGFRCSAAHAAVGWGTRRRRRGNAACRPQSGHQTRQGMSGRICRTPSQTWLGVRRLQSAHGHTSPAPNGVHHAPVLSQIFWVQ